MVRLSSYYFVQSSLFVVTLYFLPLYLQQRGLSVAQVGLVVSIGAVVSIAAQPFWGIVSDRRRTVKGVLAGLLAVSLAAGTALFGVEGLAATLATFGLFMFFFSPVTPLADSLAIRYAAERGASYGSIRLWGSAGLAVGSLLLGMAAGRWGLGLLPGIFVAVAALLLGLALLLPARAGSFKPIRLQEVGELMRDRRFLGYLGVMLLIAIPFRMNDQLFGVFLKLRGGTDTEVGLAWTVTTLCSIPAFALSRRLLERFGETRLLLFCGWMFAIRWGTMGWLHDPLWLIAHQTLNLVTVPILYFTAVIQVSKLVPDNLQATGQAVFAAVFAGVAGFAGGLLGGWGMEQTEPGAVYVAGGLVAALGTALAAGWAKAFRPSNNEQGRVEHG